MHTELEVLQRGLEFVIPLQTLVEQILKVEKNARGREGAHIVSGKASTGKPSCDHPPVGGNGARFNF